MADIPRRISGTPGVGGAFKDALKAIQDYTGGSMAREIASSKKDRIDKLAGDQDSYQRMRDAQSTDSNN